MTPKYNRVVLKLSGEALNGKNQVFYRQALDFLADEIRSVYQSVQLAIVIGGGNIVRGRYLMENFQTTPVTADHIGMAATILNALQLEDFLQREGMDTRILSALEINAVAEPYTFKRALRHLEKGRIIILAGGTGSAGVTTDTAAVLRAGDLGAQIVFKGTKVDGVYSQDPIKNPEAVFIPRLSYSRFLRMNLTGILDETAVAQAKAKGVPIRVFNIFEAGNLARALGGEEIGSLIS
ncbi:UMP kinase [candidate division WWE3 bacterium RBG_19FT_COMBO_53_11]|uniref:Uridylate kinase n=1 Tax=candidate division WWE3 bacterium RBG_19FT_COMBO_53_11 TaxID=1802613 RepID=A0A1F4UH90_UNCKA|nr:MAG: UMP kinase [candidate division WWE3 bacterium RBG_16_52_45]OGC44272.1 MAG: UMP kinase [candidate division WWE3 bacterium RBG_19FT_COMBO_53_11]